MIKILEDHEARTLELKQDKKRFEQLLALKEKEIETYGAESATLREKEKAH